MKIIEPSVELIDEINPEQILAKIERCGRVSHKSNPTGRPLHTHGATADFVRKIIKRGHESVLEHVSLTFHIICDRAIQNEIVRHRHAGFTVESTRYVKYDELTVINPFKNDPIGDTSFRMFVEAVERIYRDWIRSNCPPEIARSILPLCLATELYMTANLRQIRHILKLRTAKAAHPQMRFVAGQILNILREKMPVIVEDIINAED